jgi:hypothetical protein
MRPVTLTTSDASGGAIDSAVCPMDYVPSIPFNVGIGCAVTGTVSYSIQHTFDLTNWFENANVSSATASADTNYMFPVRAIRLHQASGSGSVVATILQAGPAR